MNDPDASIRQPGLSVLYAATVAGYPLVAGIPVAFAIDSRLSSVPYRASILVLSVGCAWFSIGRRRTYLGALWVPLIIFWVLYAARIAMDTLIAPVPLGRAPGDYAWYALGTCLVPMIGLLSLPSARTLERALWLSIGASTLAVAVVLYLGLNALLGGDLAGIETGRFALSTLNPISLGHLGASLTALALFQLVRGRHRVFSSLLLISCVVLGLVATGVSASKGPLVALTSNLALLAIIDWRQGHRARAALIVTMVVLAAVPAASLLEDIGFGVVSRLSVALDDPARLELLRGAGAQFLTHPIFGSSLDERVSLTYPHNTFVESFMAVGIVGGLAYSIFHLSALGAAIRVIFRQPAAGWVGIMCVQYSISAFFSGGIYTHNTMWGFLAAAVAVDSRLRFGRPATQPTFDAHPPPLLGSS